MKKEHDGHTDYEGGTQDTFGSENSQERSPKGEVPKASPLK